MGGVDPVRDIEVITTELVLADLDGVAKGWLADRAVALLRGYPAAIVDADGDVAAQLAEGERWVILGPNGAGKTTLIRILTQITGPDSGEVRMNGKKITRSDIEKIGYMPEERGLYKKMKIGEIKLMVEAVHSMLKTVLDSFARLDISKTIEIAKKDEAVDDQYRSTIRELLTYMLEDSKAISVSLELLVVTKALERIGDHCKNISEHIVYAVKGDDIRHSSIKEIKGCAISV